MDFTFLAIAWEIPNRSSPNLLISVTLSLPSIGDHL